MRSEQITGWLVCGLLLAQAPGNQRSDSQFKTPAGSLSGRRTSAPHDPNPPSIPTVQPMNEMRRIVVIGPEPLADPIVQQAVETERAMRSRRRRPNLFDIGPKPQPNKPVAVRKPKSAGGP